MAKEQGGERRWKSVKGRKGEYRTPVGRGELIKDAVRETWFFGVPRGAGEGGGDQWGPLDAEFPDEDAAIKAALKLERQLERAGWFALKSREEGGWRSEEMNVCLGRIPRHLVPSYFLICRDKAQAAAGQARHGDVLHVGGIDVHRVKSQAVDAGMYLDTDATVVFTSPGQKPLLRNKDAFRLHVDGAELDALIAYLLEIREQLAAPDALQASAREVDSESPGDFESAEGLRARFVRMQKKSASINEMFTRLFSLSAGNLSTLFMILNVMEGGDRIAGIRIMPDDGSPGGAIDVQASPGTAIVEKLGDAIFAGPLPTDTRH